jgi:hypothetical protein
MPVFLHVGCGPQRQQRTTREFAKPEWSELRLDIDPSVEPDIIGTMTDMSAVASASVDGIFSSHNIEHLFPHDVPTALREFRRVLKPQGYAVITCPDLQSVCALVAQGRLIEPAYVSPAGPIAPLDILYGHGTAMAAGNLYMAHRGGFTLESLRLALFSAGFPRVAGLQRAQNFDLWVIATMNELSGPELESLAWRHFPAQ